MGHETFWSIATDPAHIGAEIVWGLILDATLLPFVRWAIRRHDRNEHGEDTRRIKRKRLLDAVDQSR